LADGHLTVAVSDVPVSFNLSFGAEEDTGLEMTGSGMAEDGSGTDRS